jgi:hypothetical protein
LLLLTWADFDADTIDKAMAVAADWPLQLSAE